MGKNLKPVPEGNKGLGKLPTEVRNKMGYMAKGGRVRPKPMKAQAKPAQAKPTMTKPRPINLGTTPKPTTFTGKINTETQKLQNIDGKTVVVDKSNKPSTMARSRLKPVKLPLRMETGGLVKGGTSSQMTGKEYKGIF